MERPSNHQHHYIKAEGGDAEISRSTAVPPPPSDFVLQWGNRKRSRCMKFPAKDRDSNNQDPITSGLQLRERRPPPPPPPPPTLRSAVRLERAKDSASQQNFNDNAVSNGNGYVNLRQRSASPSPRILRNSESLVGMRAQGNGGVRGLASPDRKGLSNGVKNNSSADNLNNQNNGSASSDSKKGTSSGSDAIPIVWPPKFVIGLTTKEKEEDFMAIKGSKLPQRPKKRAKFIQRTLNLVSPGSWLCDLTLERYEVREKKVTKKRPRGLRAMGTMESDSE